MLLVKYNLYWFDPKKNLQFVGMVLRYVRLYREQERGMKTVKYRRPWPYTDLKFIERVWDHRGGAVFYQDAPVPPLELQLLPASKVGWSEPLGAGASSRTESGAAN